MLEAFLNKLHVAQTVEKPAEDKVHEANRPDVDGKLLFNSTGDPNIEVGRSRTLN